MDIHKVWRGKNEMWALIPQNAPDRRGSARLETEPWKGVRGCHPREIFLKFTCKIVTSGEF